MEKLPNKRQMSALRTLVGCIRRNLADEELVYTDRVMPPLLLGTKKWTSVVKMLGDGNTTTTQRILDMYRVLYPGSSIGTPMIAQLIQWGYLAFSDPSIRLQPGGDAFRVPVTEARTVADGLKAIPAYKLPARKEEAPASATYSDVGSELVAWQELTEELMEKGIKHSTLSSMLLGMQQG